MRRVEPLYAFTAAFFSIAVSFSIYVIYQSGLPSLDVRAHYDHFHPQISVSDFEPGDVSVVKFEAGPVIVWRRNAEDIARAKQQDVEEEWRNPFSQVSGERELRRAHDRNLTIDHEWFFVQLANTNGFGCVLLRRFGDYDGFFDPCRGAHFDLAGRIRKGASSENLRVISGQLSPDGRHIQLNLSNLRKWGR